MRDAGSIRRGPGVLALLLFVAISWEAGASRLDEIGERIDFLGSGIADAFHARCMAELPRAGDVLGQMRETAASRDRLKARCRSSYEAWREGTARLDAEGNFEEVEHHQRELLPCWDAIEAKRKEVADQARRCLEATRTPVFPLGFWGIDTNESLAPWLSCERRDLCELRPEALATLAPGWLGQAPARVQLGFSDVGIEKVLTHLWALSPAPSCEEAGAKVRQWASALERAFPDAEVHGASGPGCGARAISLGEHFVFLAAFEKDATHVAGALIVHAFRSR